MFAHVSVENHDIDVYFVMDLLLDVHIALKLEFARCLVCYAIEC